MIVFFIETRIVIHEGPRKSACDFSQYSSQESFWPSANIKVFLKKRLAPNTDTRVPGTGIDSGIPS